MKKQILATLLSITLASLPALADWRVVSTFDDESALSLITDLTNIEGSNARSAIENGKWVVYPGDLFAETSNLWAILDLGVDLKAASLASGGPVTVYLEFIQPTVPDGLGGTRKAILDTVWGISNLDASQVLETRFNSYNTMQRVGSSNDSYDGRNGTSFEGIGQLVADAVYKIWFVIDFNLNFYEAYVQGGQWPEQTRLNTLATEGYWAFRVNPGETDVVHNFMIALSRNNGAVEYCIDPSYFDNISVDVAGQNLSVPPVGDGFGKWGPWDVVDAAGNVDTGSWMGWLNVNAKPFVWSYSLNTYLYIDEGSITGGGSWAYVYN